MDIKSLEFNVSEIFYSIQGEGSRAGLPCVFIRLQGCRLRCVWCDTPYALEKKKIENIMNGLEIFERINEYECKFIEFTGGEPLEQKNSLILAQYLLDKGFTVAFETAGYLSIKDVPRDAVKIIDFKAPGSGMEKSNNYDNINYLLKHDEVKIVISDETDYIWAKELINNFRLDNIVDNILLSPVYGKIEYVDLANWILRDKLNVRMQIQLHKFIWAPDTRGV